MSDTSSLAHLLEPVLIAECRGRLSDIQWFKSAWQAGGAATGFATFAVDGHEPVGVVVKLPVGPAEFRWTTTLGGLGGLDGVANEEGGGEGGGRSPSTEVSTGYACAMGPTPRVYAAGTELGGYDLAWVVVERFTGPPLSASLSAESLEDLLSTAAEWYALAERVRPIAGATVPTKDWATSIDKARRTIPDCGIEQPQRWNQAVKQTQKLLPKLLSVWDGRPINTWCHGDLHPGNAMRRPEPFAFAGLRPRNGGGGAGGSGGGVGGCVLIDLALVHPGHWVEDAVYLERLYWGRSERLGGVKPVSALAQARRERNLPTGEDYTLLANVRRVLMAACVPCFLTHEGHPKYVRAALETLERLLPLLNRL
ncbi:MAG: phosphotransferase [Phycisphaeraceae bacterium]|nr:phosphotransferase [Phycisphaeraceae bacterium]